MEKKFVTQNVLHSWHFLQHISLGILSGKRYFNDDYIGICIFENSPTIPSFLATQIVYIGYGEI
jgi:hypothetical protein